MNKFQYAIEKQVCPECGQECAGNAKLEIHMAETHSDKKWYAARYAVYVAILTHIA